MVCLFALAAGTMTAVEVKEPVSTPPRLQRQPRRAAADAGAGAGKRCGVAGKNARDVLLVPLK